MLHVVRSTDGSADALLTARPKSATAAGTATRTVEKPLPVALAVRSAKLTYVGGSTNEKDVASVRLMTLTVFVSSRAVWRPPLIRPEIRRDYPLNLSILISGGKETNQDSPSKGD